MLNISYLSKVLSNFLECILEFATMTNSNAAALS